MGTCLGCKLPVLTCSFDIDIREKKRICKWYITFFYLYLCVCRYTWWTSTFGTHSYRLLLVVLWVLEVDLGRYILFFQVLALFVYPNSKCYRLCIHFLWYANKKLLFRHLLTMQIRSIEMLHKRFESFPEAFAKNLSPQRFLALYSEFLLF